MRNYAWWFRLLSEAVRQNYIPKYSMLLSTDNAKRSPNWYRLSLRMRGIYWQICLPLNKLNKGDVWSLRPSTFMSESRVASQGFLWIHNEWESGKWKVNIRVSKVKKSLFWTRWLSPKPDDELWRLGQFSAPSGRLRPWFWYGLNKVVTVPASDAACRIGTLSAPLSGQVGLSKLAYLFGNGLVHFRAQKPFICPQQAGFEDLSSVHLVPPFSFFPHPCSSLSLRKLRSCSPLSVNTGQLCLLSPAWAKLQAIHIIRVTSSVHSSIWEKPLRDPAISGARWCTVG